MVHARIPLRGTVIQYRRRWFARTVVANVPYDADDIVGFTKVILRGIVANPPAERVCVS